MDSWMMQVGVGGVFAVVVLRLVFDFLKSMLAKRNKCNPPPQPDGDKITRDEFDAHKAEVQYRGTCEQIVKRLENTDEHRAKTADERHEFVKKEFVEVKGMIKDLKP